MAERPTDSSLAKPRSSLASMPTEILQLILEHAVPDKICAYGWQSTPDTPLKFMHWSPTWTWNLLPGSDRINKIAASITVDRLDLDVMVSEFYIQQRHGFRSWRDCMDACERQAEVLQRELRRGELWKFLADPEWRDSRDEDASIDPECVQAGSVPSRGRQRICSNQGRVKKHQANQQATTKRPRRQKNNGLLKGSVMDHYRRQAELQASVNLSSRARRDVKHGEHRSKRETAVTNKGPRTR